MQSVNIKEQNSNLKKCIQNRLSSQKGLTIVEVMVAFVLVLLAIAMMTTVTVLATRIQKQTALRSQQTAKLSEAAYEKLQPAYDETTKSWSMDVPQTELSGTAETQLNFTGASGSFSIDVQTADWSEIGRAHV